MSQISSPPPSLELDRLQEIPALEADLAFFEARLSLLHGLPDSLYQRAQLRIYSALNQALGERLEGLRRKVRKSG